jgi:hypothetical protein
MYSSTFIKVSNHSHLFQQEEKEKAKTDHITLTQQ